LLLPLFLFIQRGCEAERCLWQIQRGGARAKQGETEQSAGFDYVLPMGKSGGKRETQEEKEGYAHTIAFYLCFSFLALFSLHRREKSA
jgi:hypothetical protein